MINFFEYNNKKYFYVLCTYKELIKLSNKLLISFKKIMLTHRHQTSFTYKGLLLEQQPREKVFYLLIYNKNHEIITTSRVSKKKYGYIDLVHTNLLYRGQGFCKININLLIKLTGYKKYELNTGSKNTTAIKCYEACGFIILNNDDPKYHTTYSSNTVKKNVVMIKEISKFKII
jgi:hypothetical protein